MRNKEIASTFNLLASLMELHGENTFKIRSYQNAYQTIRRLPDELSSMSSEEMLAIKGLGKAIVEKINNLIKGEDINALETLKEKTPPGIIEILGIKGLGAKRVKTIWETLDITTPGELLYACEENRLISLKRFGPKVQEDIKEKIRYHLASAGKRLYAEVQAEDLSIQSALDASDVRWTALGDTLIQAQEITQLHYAIDHIEKVKWSDLVHHDDQEYRTSSGFPVILESLGENVLTSRMKSLEIQPDAQKNLSVDAPEIWWLQQEGIPLTSDDLIHVSDIKGVVHNHTTYSDGIHTVEEMAEAAREKGYQYIVITDHSKAAFYANGLSVDKVYQQIEEIKTLNKKWDDFNILAGTECDILSDGSMDYPDDLLQELDVVIASIHSNLNMPLDKAMMRLHGAIAHPHVDILGHMTGRLLLSRKGYPIEHKEIIDACAEYGVVIELNANPRRLDIDFTWIRYAMEKGVLISINPDAHSAGRIDDIAFGVQAARRGGLTTDFCLNALDVSTFQKKLKSLKTQALTNH